ncbi:type II toxin-antitoxin system RelE/ParE family toxin [Methylobacterium sp. J-072]|uniref:type II toxin-antitoxin system RelE/ParE family toxin n=1 Tax=Methylobacterium sp. J-072 TaxID=2836651 RepID=UPI001FB9EB85|nr:type II toxin-antitoxin system RelE/ParE family toxin [Methylobacterium sp. J-072]MCJ2092525.1 type II toxin-antitoxin system RelE/ParE family toxin [Methylobacterium sp. J-072]
MRVREFIDDRGRSPFAEWFDALDDQAAAKVTVALLRMEQGNLSNAKSVGGGVEEYRIAWGPGYRLYFGRDGGALILLLCGGSKQRQHQDIGEARAHWAAYKRRKKEG